MILIIIISQTRGTKHKKQDASGTRSNGALHSFQLITVTFLIERMKLPWDNTNNIQERDSFLKQKMNLLFFVHIFMYKCYYYHYYSCNHYYSGMHGGGKIIET